MNERTATPAAHSTTVGGSSAAQIIQCPGSYNLLRDLKAAMPNAPEESNEAADRGTALHEAMAELLNYDPEDPEIVIGQEFYGRVISDEDYRDAITPALKAFDVLCGLCEHEGGLSFLVETQVEMPGIPDSFGTSDLIGRTDQRTVILDWKFGFNEVDPIENAQGLYYGRAAMHTRPDMFGEGDDWPVEIIIIQPQSDPVLKRWSTTAGALEAFRMRLVAKYAEAVGAVAPTFAKGPACRYCKGKPLCPAYGALLGDLPDARYDIDNATALVAAGAHRDNALSGHRLAEIMELLSDLKELNNAARELAHDLECSQAGSVPGWYLTQSWSNRSWVDPAAAEKWLRTSLRMKYDAAAPRKLITPAAVDKILKARKGRLKEIPEKYVERRVTGTKLVRDGSKAPVYTPGAEVQELVEKLAETAAE